MIRRMNTKLVCFVLQFCHQQSKTSLDTKDKLQNFSVICTFEADKQKQVI